MNFTNYNNNYLFELHKIYINCLTINIYTVDLNDILTQITYKF